MTRKMTRRSFTTLAVGVPGLAALYACTPGEPAPPSPTANVAFTEPQNRGGAESEAPAAEGEGGGTTFEVSMVDLKFEPAEFTIPADTDVTVTVVNNGALNHYWQVTDQGIESPEAQGGDTTPHDVPVNLPAGTYDFICPVPGHAAAGMVGVLTVVAGGAAPAEEAAAAPAAFGVSMVDLKFEPANFSIPANTDVTVTVVNNGALNHYWQVTDQGIESPEVQGGDTTPHDVIVNLPAGTYDFICPVPGHAAAGMVGVLTVTDEPPAGAAAPEGGTPEAGTSEAATPEAATPVATTGQAGPAGGTSFEVQMVGLAFEPASFTIPANTDVTVTAINAGGLEHNWAVEGTEIATPIVSTTEPNSVTVNLPAGSYNVLCEVPGHAAAGMVGVLTVQ